MDAKPSIIAHPAHTLVNILREEYMGICAGAKHQHCCALLLNMFEHWTNYKWDAYWKAREAKDRLSNLWIFNTQKAIQTELMELYGETVISQSLAWLDEKGFIRRRFNPKKKNDRTLQYLLMTNRVQAAVNNWAVSDNAPMKVRTFATGLKATISPASRRNTTSTRKSTPTLPQSTSQNSASTKDSASKDDAVSPSSDENVPVATKKQGKPNPWYDAIHAVWGYNGDMNGAMFKMLHGKSTAAAWKQGNLPKENALTDPAQLLTWAAWYRKTKLGGNPKLSMLEERLKIQSSIIEWQLAGCPDVDTPAPAVELTGAIPDHLFDTYMEVNASGELAHAKSMARQRGEAFNTIAWLTDYQTQHEGN